MRTTPGPDDDPRAFSILSLLTPQESEQLEVLTEQALQTGKYGVLVIQTEAVRLIEISDRVPFGTIAAVPQAHLEAFYDKHPIIE
jgi:hypothetical protein